MNKTNCMIFRAYRATLVWSVGFSVRGDVDLTRRKVGEQVFHVTEMIAVSVEKF